ncbi:MAG: adenylate/guanylate cyclase domain-containing protein [Pseudomonadota bacterium]
MSGWFKKAFRALNPQLEPGIAQAFQEAEQAGLKIAIKGRLVALVLMGLFLVLTRSQDPQRVIEFSLALAFFCLLGLGHFWLIGSPHDRPWVKYIFVTIDFAALSFLIASQPLLDTVDLPQVITFRNAIFPFYFVILGVAAFSFSPGLVLWSGLVGVAGWLGAFVWSIRDMAVTYDWTDIGPYPTTEHFSDIFLSPNFVGTGSRIQESLAFFVVAVLIAAVMWRARRTVQKQLESEAQQRQITEIFGKYVPKQIADALIADQGLLEPIERPATVMFLDIAGFTKLTEAAGPKKVVPALNAFFDGAGEIIGHYKGVVTQFQGDAIMATFNLPLEDLAHAQNAVQAGREITRLVQETEFEGLRFRVRIGISTGPVLAGSVGSRGRQNYTVYGDNVNLAARLEALNKDYQTDVLIDAATHQRLEGIECREIGQISVRGFSGDVAVFSPSEKSAPAK